MGSKNQFSSQKLESCQTCSSKDLVSALNLGYLPPVNTMSKIGSPLDSETWFPAEIFYCQKCHLVQMGCIVNPEIVFPPDYAYTSGTTRILRENFQDLFTEAKKLLSLSEKDLIVDIGSNDGTLLSNFQNGGCKVQGIEPTQIGLLARERGIPTLTSYFNAQIVKEVSGSCGKARIVTATNVFAHIPNPNQVVEDIADLLTEDGVLITESHYLGDLIATTQYDTIYHEHLRYYSLLSKMFLLESHGFKIFHIKRIPTHGGSIRVYASRSNQYEVQPSVNALLSEEKTLGLDSTAWIPRFRHAVVQSKLDLYKILAQIKSDGRAIYGISAPSRASTLIHSVGLDEQLLDCVLEIKGSKKIGKYIPGTKIPVLDEEKLNLDKPPYVLVLAWHIQNELIKNLKKSGFQGDFIVPLPTPLIIKNSEV